MSKCEHPHGGQAAKGPHEIKVTIPPHAAVGEDLCNGVIESAVVSQSAKVFEGEFILKVLEYTPKEDVPMRCATDGVKILDTVELSQGRVGVVFTQNGKTKFKVIAIENDTVAMGNTIVLLEDAELDEVALVEKDIDRAVIIYEQDGDGMASVISLNGRTATMEYSDIWSEGGEPANLTACILPSGWLLISAVLRQAMPREGGKPGECWVWTFRENATKKTITGSYLLAERMDGDNDTDIYAGGWSMAAVDDYTAVLTFPQALDKPIGFAVIDIDLTGGAGGGINFRVISHGKYANSLPALQTVGLSHGRWITAYGVCWLSEDKKVNKSGIAFEVWGLSRYAAQLIWYGCDDTRYRSSVGNVSVASAGPQAVAITYTGSTQTTSGDGEQIYTDDTKVAYMALEDGPAPGAAVSLPQHNGFCRLVPISVTKALLIWSADGNLYAQYMALEKRVVPANPIPGRVGHSVMDGIALTGGDANETISVRVLGPEP